MRLFVALDLTAKIRDALRDLIATVQSLSKTARWARPERVHVTLKFIGHVEPDKLDAIRAALATIRSSAPVDMDVRGVGFFPDERRPRVLWCGIEASANLAPLAAEIETVLEPLGIPREERKFTPHLTLARLKDSRGIDELLHAAQELKSRDFGSVRAAEFHLFESVTKPSGAEYKKIETYAFVKGAA